MAERPRPYNAHGERLPELTDARHESRYDRPQNVELRQYVITRLEECWWRMLRRGVHGRVTLSVSIEDGCLMRQIYTGEERTYRYDMES